MDGWWPSSSRRLRSSRTRSLGRGARTRTADRRTATGGSRRCPRHRPSGWRVAWRYRDRVTRVDPPAAVAPRPSDPRSAEAARSPYVPRRSTAERSWARAPRRCRSPGRPRRRGSNGGAVPPLGSPRESRRGGRSARATRRQRESRRAPARSDEGHATAGRHRARRRSRPSPPLRRAGSTRPREASRSSAHHSTRAPSVRAGRRSAAGQQRHCEGHAPSPG